MAAKTAKKTMTVPQFDQTAFKAFWSANLGVAVQAQRMMIDAAEAMFVRQIELTREAVNSAQKAVLDFDLSKNPENYANDVKAAAERAQKIVKMEMDTGIQVQKDIVELVGKQVAANVDELKKFAA